MHLELHGGIQLGLCACLENMYRRNLKDEGVRAVVVALGEKLELGVGGLEGMVWGRLRVRGALRRVDLSLTWSRSILKEVERSSLYVNVRGVQEIPMT